MAISTPKKGVRNCNFVDFQCGGFLRNFISSARYAIWLKGLRLLFFPFLRRTVTPEHGESSESLQTPCATEARKSRSVRNRHQVRIGAEKVQTSQEAGTDPEVSQNLHIFARWIIKSKR